jgi:hypothetical protein
LCLLGQPLDICERAEITSGLAARQAPGIGVFGCAVEGEITRDPAPIIALALGWCDWTIFLLPSKNMKSIKSLVSKSVFGQVFGAGAKPIFRKSKCPPPGGLAGKLNNFNRGGQACRPLVQRDQHGLMGSNAKRGHWLIELFNKDV